MTSRKDYERIAKILGQENSKSRIINRIANYFAEDNTRFNRKKFVEEIAMQHYAHTGGMTFPYHEKGYKRKIKIGHTNFYVK